MRIFIFIISLLPSRKIDSLIKRLISIQTTKKDPAAGLKYLFELDDLTYELEGELAIQYGGGSHTKHKHMRYDEYFLSKISDTDSVVDIGCSRGALTSKVADKVKGSVLGIDIDVDAIKDAREKYKSVSNLNFINGDATVYPFKDKVDTVIMSNVLEHIEDRATFLNLVKNQLKPKKFLIRVPSFDRDWRVPLRKELNCEWRLDKTHYIEYFFDEFEAELANANLVIIDHTVCWGEIWAEVRCA